jgi:hypothetical protein
MRTLFVLLLLCLAAGSASAQTPPPNNPCADSLYQALRRVPLDSLSDRQYDYFTQRERTCTEWQRLRALAEAPEGVHRAPTSTSLRGAIETFTRPVRGGAEIHFRNTSDQPIMVTSIRLSDCSNLATSCGMHPLNIRLAPGQSRRGLLIRFGSDNFESNYRYEYRTASVEP